MAADMHLLMTALPGKNFGPARMNDMPAIPVTFLRFRCHFFNRKLPKAANSAPLKAIRNRQTGFPSYLYAMPIYRFRVFWEEDDLVYRDIEVQAMQSLMDFHFGILKAYDFDSKFQASFWESDDRWTRGRKFSSDVLVNKKGADALSMQKAPLAALIADPGQKFVYEYDPSKHWIFLVELIGVEKVEARGASYPRTVRKEGVGPTQYGAKAIIEERMMNEEEAYDLTSEELEEGFSADSQEEET